jgi:selenoprotein W-related protein
MVSGLLEEFEHKIEDVTVIPSRGGVFEVMANDKLIYSKKATGEHAEYEDVAGPLRELLDA